jgi:IS605 OrfB family transposase
VTLSHQPETMDFQSIVVHFCIKHQAGTLILLNQEDKMEIAKKEDGFILRNWNYYELMTKIKYKAEKAGIELIVD